MSDPSAPSPRPASAGLGRRIRWIVFITTALLLILVFLAYEQVVVRRLEELEVRTVRAQVDQVLASVAQDCDALDRTVLDWSAWDDAYAFADGDDPGFVQTNLVSTSFDSSGFRLNAILYLDPSGRILYAGGFDLAAGQSAPVPEGLLPHLSAEGLLSAGRVNPSVKGFLATSDGLLLAASRQILTSMGGGPPRGWLVMARRFDAQEVARVGRRIGLSLEMEAGACRQPSDGHAVLPLSRSLIQGGACLSDIHGAGVGRISVLLPRDISAEARRSRRFLMVALLLTGSVTGAVTLLGLHRWVHRPVERLARQVAGIAGSPGSGGRVTVDGPEEIRDLSIRINAMLDERDHLQTRLLQTERLRVAGELSAGVSHNLNNLLTGILGPLDLIDQGAVDERTGLGIVRRSAERARDLVRRLNSAVRPQALEPLQPVDVNAVILDAIETARPRWQHESASRGAPITVEHRLAEIPPAGAGHAELHAVLLNLLFNAVDAMPGGGAILLETLREDDAVLIRVRDTGVGMDEATRLRVFEPFFTTKRTVGTGLGLAEAFGAVSRWGGSIDVESRPGEGALFTLRLPLAPVPVPTPSAPGPLSAHDRLLARRRGAHEGRP